ncbi:MAG: hypothetical protein HY735_08025 [Verrucomicrobia bacterium]|nr:hypothetical protein [Verrucomicrobiota bacterium]
MSTSKLDTSGVFQPLHLRSQGTQLSLPTHAIRFRKNGIEFCSAAPIPKWTEMTVDLHSSRDAKKVHCTGIVVDCAGSRHTGYLVSMVFMNLTRQAQERLSQLAFSQAA